MKCSHCNTDNSINRPFDRPVDGGRAFAQVCAVCGHTLGIRPRIESDPPVLPVGLSEEEVARLRFLRWRLEASHPGDDMPLSAA